MKVKDFDYDLPDELIAQKPSNERDQCKLMVINRENGEVSHRHFYQVLEYINPGDCLVLNDSKVIPARIFGQKESTLAKVEFLLIKRIEGDTWQVMVRPGRKIKPGDTIIFGENFKGKVIDFGEDGTRIVEFIYQGIFMEELEKIGSMPLPPYIERPSNKEDQDRYQTVYCKDEGSIAAPTAGLHFTKELLEAAKAKGINVVYVTLHVGIGTFRPVKCDKVEEHNMHFEEYWIPEHTANVINETKAKGGKIISVGTTSTRTLESAAKSGKVLSGQGSTCIFIYPGYEFEIVDRLITNFHLPKSTLIMLISALYNREKIMEAYQEAVDQEYKFFSYGDGMIIL